MRSRSTRINLIAIFILTAAAICIVWPSDPDRYLPDFVPWPTEDCIGPVCMGKGARLPYIDFKGSTLGIGHLERREMQLGLDLKGGTRLVLEADVSAQPDIDLDEALDSAVDVVERRVNAFGVAESITERVGSNRISVQLPGISAAEAIEKIGQTAQLQFMEMACVPAGGPDTATRGCQAGDNVLIKQPDGTITQVPFTQVATFTNTARGRVPTAEYNEYAQRAVYIPVSVVDSEGVRREINGSYLNRGDVFVSQDPTLGSLPVLNFGLNDEGAKLLGQATARLSSPQQPMAFFLDGIPICSPTGGSAPSSVTRCKANGQALIAPLVQSQISDKGTITGLNGGDARTLSTLLRTGAFPVPLRVVQQDDVDATLGDAAVVKSVEAGLVAILIVMLFMTSYYRLPGLLASFALFVYVSLTLALFKLAPVTVTSAGMAAFVLSVGMAVDANILIFERMKEELRLGRSLIGAIDAGFSRAWTSIRDSNVATLIICFVLYWFADQFAASLVKGFALTLALGVLVSMFSAIVVTRTFLRALVGTNVMNHLWLFGSDVEEARGHLAPAPTFGGRAIGPGISRASQSQGSSEL